MNKKDIIALALRVLSIQDYSVSDLGGDLTDAEKVILVKSEHRSLIAAALLTYAETK